METKPCPVCTTPDAMVEVRVLPSQTFHFAHVKCPTCGEYYYDDELAMRRLQPLKDDASPRWRIAGSLRQQEIDKAREPQRIEKLNRSWELKDYRVAYPYATAGLIEEALRSRAFPSPTEQTARLVRYLGAHLEDLGESTTQTSEQWAAISGSNGPRSAELLIHELERRSVLSAVRSRVGTQLSLTYDGWVKHHESEVRGREAGRAFMALEFGDEETEVARKGPFFKACKSVGFELRDVREGQGAGLIDDHIRHEIMRSHFVIADISTGNKNVLWEAGFAHGLGKPVIYTCREEAFNEQVTRTFDVSHRHALKWNADDPQDAQERLEEIIAVTLADIERFSR